VLPESFKNSRSNGDELKTLGFFQSFRPFSAKKGLIAKVELMLLGEMTLLDFFDASQCSDTFSEPNHNIKDKIPIFVSKIDSHFPFGIFSFLLMWFFFKIEFNLHLF
jgi:hypothetical protein